MIQIRFANLAAASAIAGGQVDEWRSTYQSEGPDWYLVGQS